jgi:hypothetical protein
VESAALYSLNHLMYAVLYAVKTQVESTLFLFLSLTPNRVNILPDEASVNRKQVWRVSPVV